MAEKNFALIGVGGYVAPRHLKAIKETGNNLIMALDPNDSVGILDSHFDDVDFFTEFERFDRHLQKLEMNGEKLDYVSICSPNYLHDAHIRFALRNGADAICEKPLVLNTWNLEHLQDLEKKTGCNIYTILQLRNHPSVIELKEKYANTKKRHQVNLKYITPRGKWYHYSWKGILEKSGGLASNIGVHFFDMLSWIFGKTQSVELKTKTATQVSGVLKLEHADVNWFLSIDKNDLPSSTDKSYRLITVDGEEVEFSSGFTDLHTKAYEEILEGKGYGLEDAKPSIQVVQAIRNLDPEKNATQVFRSKIISAQSK